MPPLPPLSETPAAEVEVSTPPRLIPPEPLASVVKPLALMVDPATLVMAPAPPTVMLLSVGGAGKAFAVSLMVPVIIFSVPAVMAPAPWVMLPLFCAPTVSVPAPTLILLEMTTPPLLASKVTEPPLVVSRPRFCSEQPEARLASINRLPPPVL